MLSLSPAYPSASPKVFSTHASPWRFPARLALSSAMRWVAMQSAQPPRRSKMLSSGAGMRQAISCRPADEACSVAAIRLARSLSYQARASSAAEKASGG
jgi:hypothetical protein